MVARTPPKQRKVLAPLNPVLLRETVKKVQYFYMDWIATGVLDFHFLFMVWPDVENCLF